MKNTEGTMIGKNISEVLVLFFAVLNNYKVWLHQERMENEEDLLTQYKMGME